MKPSEDKQQFLKPGLANQFLKVDFSTPDGIDERTISAAIQEFYNTVEYSVKYFDVPSRIKDCKRVNIKFTTTHVFYFDLDIIFDSLLYQSLRL